MLWHDEDRHSLATGTPGFISDESGATAIEYGLIAALIAVGIIEAATTLGGSPPTCSVGSHEAQLRDLVPAYLPTGFRTLGVGGTSAPRISSVEACRQSSVPMPVVQVGIVRVRV